jgi:epoxyqueuosine reductase
MVVALPCAGEGATVPGDGAARGRIARYAWGRDYHRVFEPKLRRIAKRIRSELGAPARGTVDYGPLLERPWAAVAGLGWLGKSSMTLAPGLGPWVMLGVVVTALDVEPDVPLKKSCGACTRCIVACPTGAISPEGHVLDARLCISYHTIENRGPIPRELRAKFGDWVFGCDDCLSSCPVGRSARDSHPDFVPASVEDARPLLRDLLGMGADEFATRFRGRAILRAKRDGMVRNACVALGNIGGPEDLPQLYAALCDRSAVVRGHAAWAIGRLAVRNGVEASVPTARLRAALAAEGDEAAHEEVAAALIVLAAREEAGDERSARRVECADATAD